MNSGFFYFLTRVSDFAKIVWGDFMTLNVPNNIIDILMIIIFVFSLINGYRKGIVDRLLHFISTLFILAISWFLSKPLAGFFSFETISQFDQQMMSFISPIIGRIVGFICVFVVLSIIRLIVFKLLNVLIKQLKKSLTLVRWVDNILGALFNVAKNTIIVYMALLTLSLPYFTNGLQLINESKLAPKVMAVAPSISEEIISFGQEIVTFINVDQWANRDFNMADMVKLLDTMSRFDVLAQGQIDQFYMTYQSQIDSIPAASVDQKQYQELMDVIDRLPAGDALKAVARSKITLN